MITTAKVPGGRAARADAPSGPERPRARGNAATRSEPADRPLPPGPAEGFGVASLLRYARSPLGFLNDVRERYGDLAHIKMLGRSYVMVNHPEEIEAVLVKSASHVARDAYTKMLRRALGAGLLTSEGDLWKRQRKLMAQAFTPKRIRAYGDAMVAIGKRGLGPLEDGGVVDIHAEMSRITMEVVAGVLFGSEVSESDVATVRESMETINEFFANSPEAVLRVPPRVPTPRNRRMNGAVRALDELVYRILAARRAAPPREDLLGTLLAAVDDEGTGMTDEQLRDETITLFLAGHETTALALGHTLYLLSTHPEVQRRLCAEIDEVLGGRDPSPADLPRLPFTEQVLLESMRLYPPAWITGREVLEDLSLRGYRIPRGVQLITCQWVVHRDPRYFENPEGFDPDRFSAEQAGSLPRYAYFPFGGGPRVCIGNHFAMTEACLLLALLTQRFRFDLAPGEHLEFLPTVTLRPRGGGLRMRVCARDDGATADAPAP